MKQAFYGLNFRTVFLSLILWGMTGSGIAQGNFSGIIRDSVGSPLSWASVSIDGGKLGTLSDEEGAFTMEVPEGQYTILVTRLGYTPYQDEISVPASLEITLKEEAYQVADVLIFGEENPATAIMREAIRRKKTNRVIAESYHFQAYTKSALKFASDFSLDSLAKNLIGDEVPNTEELKNIPVFRTGLLYLSETNSIVRKTGNNIHEEILMSQVSGSEEDISLFGSLLNQFDPYENRSFRGETAERGIVSPVADQALLVYEYKLMGLISHQGRNTYRIRLQPKRTHDAAFFGELLIDEETFAIAGLDWKISKEQAIQVVDSIRVRQNYLLSGQKWLPAATRTDFRFSFEFVVIALPINGSFTSIMTEYVLDPPESTDRKGGEIMTFSPESTNHDSMAWELRRPLPLTEIEVLDYRLKDSVAALRNSPEYLDSLTSAQPFPGPINLFLGYTRENYRKNSRIRFAGLANSGFNAIEGWYLDTGAGYEKTWGNFSTGINLIGRGAFAARRIHGIGEGFLKWDGHLPAAISVSAGDYPYQFSGFEQIQAFANTFGSLWYKRSHVRLYESRFAKMEGMLSPFPGLSIEIGSTVEERSPLTNTADYSIRFRERSYEENISFDAHQAWISGLSISYQPGTKFIRLPDRKMILDSKWPTFSATFTAGTPLNQQSPSFSKLVLSIDGTTSTGPLGSLRYQIGAGQFLSAENAYIQDQFHFRGGETFFRMRNDFNTFFLMPYYSYYGTERYVEAHVEQSFGMFGISKIPGLRKLKLSEYAGAHFLAMETRSPYLEIGYGLEARIFKVLKIRLDMNIFILGEERWLPYAFTYHPQSLVGLTQ